MITAMTQPFPRHPFLSGPTAPSGIECDAPDLIIEGELPADLRGLYFRNGPDPLYPPREGDEYHWFHGDGMIQRFEFSDGRVSWKNRWVRTEKYTLERAAGRSLFGVLGNPMKSDPTVAGEHYNTANTHVVWHGNRLMALMEGTIDVGGSTDTVGEEQLDDIPCEFPRTDDRFMTRAHRHAWLVGGADAQLMFNRLVHFDRVTGTRKLWGDDKFLLGEPVFAPRSASAPEGDGYVLILAYYQSTALSQLLVFVATDIERGPVARARLPLRIPAGFHGTWVGA